MLGGEPALIRPGRHQAIPRESPDSERLGLNGDELADARERARRMLDKVEIAALAVDVVKIAESLGLHMMYQAFNEDLSAVPVKTGECIAIGFNYRHARTRQRFSLAHELGHY